MVDCRTFANAFGRRVIVAMLSLCAAGQAVGAGLAVAEAADQELDQVTVTGARIKATRSPQVIVDWLKRLVGQFRYEGDVDLHGAGASGGKQRVKGAADCVSFGLAPAVQCTLNVAWPETRAADGQTIVGGVSSLNPAMIMYGFDPDHLGIHYLQVDSAGMATGALGYLKADTLTTTAPCVDLPGNCQRITRIDARPDGKVIQMQIDIMNDDVNAASFHFVLLRLAKEGTGQVPVP